MVAWAVVNMGGEIPKQDPRLLPDNMADQAWNTDLVSGPLDGLAYPELVKDISAVPGYSPGITKRVYRVPQPASPPPGFSGDAWLCLSSPFACVTPSPITNDTLHRVYYTVPGDRARWTTYDKLISGSAPYDLGFYAPSTVLTITAAGGSQTPQVSRSYLYTFVDVYGLESSPSLPSAVTTGFSDGGWNISGIGLAVSQHAPETRSFPPVASIRIYRTITGQTQGAAFYKVLEFPLGTAPAGFVDLTRDVDIVGAPILESVAWASPPLGLDGLLMMPGGFLVGFTGNTLHFSEPYRPHAWPPGYDLSVQYDIVALALWNQTLVVLTKGYPSTGTGNAPSAFTLSQVQVNEPCIDRGSVITDLLGVYYASQNGITMLNYYGMQNQTLQTVDRRDWLTTFGAGSSLIAVRHRAQYLAFQNQGQKNAFIIDYSDQRLGVVWTDMLRSASAIWSDVYTGDTYFLANSAVYRWDSQSTGAMPYRWRSKVFNLVEPVNLGACQITVDGSLTAAPPTPPAGLAPVTVVPNGANCWFRLWVEGKLVYDQPVIDAPQATFRLPSGYKAYQFQFEILSNVPVSKVKLATSMLDLNNV